jgi:hypothetical protein
VGRLKVSEKTLKRVRDYAIDEPSFTCAFAAWDMTRDGGAPITDSTIANAVAVLLDKGIVKLVEEHGRAGKVYAYDPPQATTVTRRSNFPELDDAHLAEIGVDAQPRGVVVPHTRARGTSGKPGLDRHRQEQGVRIKKRRAA